ncbi:hypothetical protein PBCV1_A246R [Paramecium bursaria Chlorella virus 1]|uniref:Barwin domain-containing protein n=1 Tax=Paramecium bursaria Chlorella virus 1 TaxID=10506 RepID=Q84565_PBCV1|nr:hypothetical protein PBCV1_A246R [Paramecium bursaria Chlorella virus 1]AAC96614.2 hypothetical protein [Paramecium bursaria Chlorella virus 1]
MPSSCKLWGDAFKTPTIVPGGISKKDVRMTYHYYAPNYETSSLACADRFWADKDNGRKLLKYPWAAYCLDGRNFKQSTCGKCFRATNRANNNSVIFRAVDFGGCSDPKDQTGIDADPCLFNALDAGSGAGIRDGAMRVDVIEVDCGADATFK